MRRFFQEKRTALLDFLRAFLLFLLVFFTCPLSFYAQQGAQPQESERTLEQLGTAIHSSLAALKARSQSLTEELNEQHLIVEEYKTKLSALTTSLDNTNKRLYDYETKLIGYEQKLKSRAKIILAAAIIILINILGKIAAIVLRFKGIKLPEVFNILW